jgi:hypothetical protein
MCTLDYIFEQEAGGLASVAVQTEPVVAAAMAGGRRRRRAARRATGRRCREPAAAGRVVGGEAGS